LLAKLSIMSVGGGTAALAEMQRDFVSRGWLTPQQFLEAYAIGQITPGPGVALVVPLGYATAGILGGVVALLAFFVPAAVIALVAARAWSEVRRSPWAATVRAAIVPVGTGLTLGSAYTLARSGLQDPPSIVIAGATFGILVRTKLPIPFVLAGAGLLGAVLTGANR
jgi:chromate transporter